MSASQGAVDDATGASFRAFVPADAAHCVALFDDNCPAYFAPNERADYIAYLDTKPDDYEVCELDGAIVGAYGVHALAGGEAALHWILLAPAAQGRGLGAAIMSRVARTLDACNLAALHISASHRSAPFFARHGAVEDARIADGWGPGMHRVEMRIVRPRPPPRCMSGASACITPWHRGQHGRHIARIPA